MKRFLQPCKLFLHPDMKISYQHNVCVTVTVSEKVAFFPPIDPLTFHLSLVFNVKGEHVLPMIIECNVSKHACS